MKNSGSEESLAVGCTRFCVRHFPPVDQRWITQQSPRINTPLLRPAPDLSPLSVQGQCRCPGSLYYLISAKTSLFFFVLPWGGSWSFMLSLSIIYACFYVFSLESFVVSIIIVSQPLTPLRRLLRLQSVTQNARDGGSLRGEGGGWSRGK